MPEIQIDVPEGMSKQVVAETFAAYLLGSQAHDNPTDPVYYRQRGPFFHDPKAEDKEDDWLLDPSNDFRLKFDSDSSARLICRDNGKPELAIKMMAAFFTLQYHSLPGE